MQLIFTDIENFAYNTLSVTVEQHLVFLTVEKEKQVHRQCQCVTVVVLEILHPIRDAVIHSCASEMLLTTPLSSNMTC